MNSTVHVVLVSLVVVYVSLSVLKFIFHTV